MEIGMVSHEDIRAYSRQHGCGIIEAHRRLRKLMLINYVEQLTTVDEMRKALLNLLEHFIK